MNNTLLAIIYIIVGLALCFAGFKIQKAVIAIAWFLLGYQLSNLILTNVITDPKILILVCIVIGIVCGSLGFKLEKLAIFIAVAYFTFETLSPYINFFDEAILNLLITVGIALIVGGFSTALIRPILIIVTGIYGAMLIETHAISLITTYVSIAIPAVAGTVALVIFAILGIVTQFKTTK